MTTITIEEALSAYKLAGEELKIARDKFIAAFEDFKKNAYGIDLASTKPIGLHDAYRREMLEFGAAIDLYGGAEIVWFQIMEEADKATSEKLESDDFWETASHDLLELKKMETLADARISEVQARFEAAAAAFSEAECAANFNAMDDLRLEKLGAINDKHAIQCKMHEVLYSELN